MTAHGVVLFHGIQAALRAEKILKQAMRMAAAGLPFWFVGEVIEGTNIIVHRRA